MAMSRPLLHRARVSACSRPAGRLARRPFSSLMSTAGFSENQLMVREAMAHICARFPNAYWRQRNQAAQDPHEFHAALARDGGGRLLTETIPGIVAGRWRVCFGVTEPNAGLDTRSLATAAERVGDEFRITGQKTWISCAQVAAKMVLLARTAPGGGRGGGRGDGLSLLCIDLDRGAPGLEVRRIAKMGGRAVDANDVFFDGYRVPAAALVGAEGSGFRTVLHGLNAERCLVAGERAVLAHGGMGYAAEYDVERWFRESLVPRIAPVSREMVLNYISERVLRLPQSY